MAALTANTIPKATDGTHIGDSKVIDNGTTLTYDGSPIPTNSAPAETIPVTVDGSGNLGDSKVTSDADPNPTIGFVTDEDGIVTLQVVGLGGQLFIKAADGDADHSGGEVHLTSGSSIDNNAGDLTIEAGSDAGEGDGGNITIKSGNASDGLDNGGSSGEIAIKVGGGAVADSQGGQIVINGGIGQTGGGTIFIQPGASTVSGSHGRLRLFSALGTTEAALSETSLTVTTPLFDITADTSINLGTPQVQVNATVTAGGTTGVQTIDKSAGSINFAASNASKVVNNSTVTADSIVIATVATVDATMKSVVAVAGTGTITFTAGVAPSGEVRVNFWVITPQ